MATRRRYYIKSRMKKINKLMQQEHTPETQMAICELYEQIEAYCDKKDIYDEVLSEQALYLYATANKYEEAIEKCDKYLARAMRDEEKNKFEIPKLMLSKGHSYSLLRQIPDAEKLLFECAQRYTNLVFRNDNSLKAQELYALCCRLLTSLYWKGKFYDKSERFALEYIEATIGLAISDYDKKIEDVLDAHRYLVITYIKEGKYDEAYECMVKCVESYYILTQRLSSERFLETGIRYCVDIAERYSNRKLIDFSVKMRIEAVNCSVALCENYPTEERIMSLLKLIDDTAEYCNENGVEDKAEEIRVIGNKYRGEGEA